MRTLDKYVQEEFEEIKKALEKALSDVLAFKEKMDK